MEELLKCKVKMLLVKNMEYGKYEFDSILNAFKDSNSVVIEEVRIENVDYL